MFPKRVPFTRDPAGQAYSVDLPRSPGQILLRQLASNEDFRACVDLQQETWGEGFPELVPLSILKASQRIGGVVAGAFEPGGGMLGFVFGMTGIEEGEIVHWSDMLAVRRDARDLGIGRELKHFQARALRPLGIQKIYWTYDPLVARNAHLNLNRLRVKVVEYVPEMYGAGSGNLQGFGTDRFIVAWQIGRQAREGSEQATGAPRDPTPGLKDAPFIVDAESAGEEWAPLVRIEVPPDIQGIRDSSPVEAARWRQKTRRSFVEVLERGYQVIGFHREGALGPCYYVLADPSPEAPED